MDDARVRQELIALDTPTLSDALDSCGKPAAIGGLTAFGPPVRIAGRARTVSLVADDGRERGRHLGAGSIDASEPGDVIIVAHHGPESVSGWGGLLATAAKIVGVSGVIVDGACRDVDDYVALDFPVYARRAVPRSARGRVLEDSSDEPVELSGLLIEPRSWVVCDRSGLVVIEQAMITDVLRAARAVQRRERAMADDLRAGAKAATVLGTAYETMLGPSLTED
jgi:4-hydroxy-4-methyl-2-oxoglutarate aldolase